jgi:hypothetical protein
LSVQIWATKLDALRLPALPGRREIYAWPYEYDPDMLGYMAGILKLTLAGTRGNGRDAPKAGAQPT